MSSISEVGHANIVANFQDLIEFVKAYGPIYNPSKASLQLPALITLHATASAQLLAVITTSTDYNHKVNDRIIAFQPIRPLSTRLYNALLATDASAETIRDAHTINRKIQGKRATTTTTPTTTDPHTDLPARVSSSQQSYDQLIQHLTALLHLLQSEPTYLPHETELQVLTIQDYITTLDTCDTAVSTTFTALSNARITRNKILYSAPDSLFSTAKEVKQYIKSLFGATSPHYKQIQSIKFHKRTL